MAYLGIKMSTLVAYLVTVLGTFMLSFAGELTFELPDNERQCFHEVIDKGVKCTIEFQVIQNFNATIRSEVKDFPMLQTEKEIFERGTRKKFLTA